MGHAMEQANRLRAGKGPSGFRVLRVRSLPDLRCVAVEALHEATRANLVALISDDTEKLFSIAVRTPPPDDTGLPHILEHSVLGGSRRYPVREPFVELLKTSLATFLNAMTYPDRTVYPVASTVDKDFFNLADVYFDAVFHPNITPTTLKQEGHHLAFAEPGNIDSPLIIKGIVYNEMKGAYSNPDSVVARRSLQGLFPDTPYGRDSGGDPEAIPRLTYNRFRRFYERYYRPPNVFIFTYGDVPFEKICAFLDERLREVDRRRPVRTDIPRQPRWDRPREIEDEFPVAPGEDPRRKSAVTVNWIVGDCSEPLTSLAMAALDHLLLGTAAAPLRKALIDSGLGEDLVMAGFDEGLRETTFHVGLKGTDPEHKDRIVEIVMDTLNSCARDGFPDDQVETAFRQLDYSHREIQSEFPLRLMGWVYSSWLYGLDPLIYLHTPAHLVRLREMWGRDKQIFQRLIRERLIDNPHCLTVVVRPSPGLLERKEKALARRLARKKARMSREELLRIDREARELERIQSTPDPPEALEKLPQLQIEDVPKAPPVIPTEIATVGKGAPVLRNDVFANGLNYLTLAFDLSGLPQHLWPWLPLYTFVFNRLGAAGASYLEMSERIAAATGGLSASASVITDEIDPNRFRPVVTVRMLTLDRTWQEALGVLGDLVRGLDVTDVRRLRDVVLQLRARTRSAVVPSGHRLALRHAARAMSPAARIAEVWRGLPAIRRVHRLADDFDAQVDVLQTRLEEIRDYLAGRAPLAASFTGTASLFDSAAAWIADFAPSGIDVEKPGFLPEPGEATSPRTRVEGLAVEADVAFCARVLPAPRTVDPDAEPLRVFAQILAFDYLWEEVRAKGGAYGGSCSYDGATGMFGFYSYRDPWITRTLRVYDGVEDYAKQTTWTPRDIERAVIGSCKGEERPIRPGPATDAALGRWLARLTEEERRRRRLRLLEVSPEAVRDAALGFLQRGSTEAQSCIVAARRRLEEAAREMGVEMDIEDVFPQA